MIICCGEALIDMLPRQIADGSDTFLPVSGGAIFNTAIALGRLDVATGFLCGVSNDMFGQQLVETLQKSGVNTTLLVRSDRPTTLAFVKLADGAATYSFYDENTAMRMLQPADCPALPAETTAVHFGGISLVSEPCGQTYEQLMQQAKNSHTVSIDPNIRPGFITDETAYRARLETMMTGADIIKVSDEDLDWLHPGEVFEDVAQRWLRAGTKLAIQTLGEQGAQAVTADLSVRMAGRPVQVVDTVGAGDTFNAGLLSALDHMKCLARPALSRINESEILRALERGAEVAAHTVGQAGANAPWKHEISALS